MTDSDARIRIDYANTRDTLDDAAMDAALGRVRAAHGVLSQRNGPGNDFLGWVDLPAQARDSLQRVADAAARIREEADALVVVGIGGSYPGITSTAAISAR